MSNQQKSMETGRKSTKDENRTDTRETKQNALASSKLNAKPHSADWMKYDPKQYGRESLYEAVLTAEQRAQIFDVPLRMKDRRSSLAEYCTPENAGWIFAVADAVTHDLYATGKVGDESAPFAFLMGMEFEPVYLASPRTLHAVITARLNAYYDASPEMLDTAFQAVLIAGDYAKIETIKARVISVYDGWNDMDSGLADKLLE